MVGFGCIVHLRWLYHHSFFYRSKDGENPNVDNLEVGVFPAQNDNLKLELAWTIVPFILIVYLTHFLGATRQCLVFPNDGHFGNECVYDSPDYDGSNLYFDYDANLGEYKADCYHTIEITAKQWVWSFDCEYSKQNYVNQDLLRLTEEPFLISLYRQGMHISHT